MPVASAPRLLLAPLLVALALAGPAAAQALDGALNLGDRFEGLVAHPDDVDVVRFAGLGQERVTLTVRRAGGSAGGGLRPRLELYLLEVPGQPGNLLASDSGNVVARIGGFVLPATGTYELRVSSLGDTTGAWRLRTRGRLPGKFARLGPPNTWSAPGESTILFDGREGYAISGVVRRKQGDLVPLAISLDDPGGAHPLEPFVTTQKQGGLKVESAPLLALGEHALHLTLAGDEGKVASSLRLRRAPGKRRTLREAAVDGLVPAPGTVLLDEQPSLSVLSMDSGGLVLSVGEGAPTIEAGQLVASAAGGWLREVLSVTPGADDTLELSTAAAELPGAFDAMLLSFAVGGLSVPTTNDESPPPGVPAPVPVGLGLDLAGTLLFDDSGLRVSVASGRVVFSGALSGGFDQAADALDLDVDLLAAGYLELDLEADAALDLQGGNLPLWVPVAEVTGPFGQSFGFELQVELLLDVSFDGPGTSRLGVSFVQPLVGAYRDVVGEPATWIDDGSPGSHAAWIPAPDDGEPFVAATHLELAAHLAFDIAGLRRPVLDAGPRLDGLLTTDRDLEDDVPWALAALDAGFLAHAGTVTTLDADALAEARRLFGGIVATSGPTCPFDDFGALLLEQQVPGLGWVKVASRALSGGSREVFAPLTHGTYRVRAVSADPEVEVLPDVSDTLSAEDTLVRPFDPPAPAPAAFDSSAGFDPVVAYDLSCECTTCDQADLVVAALAVSPEQVPAWQSGSPLMVDLEVVNASSVDVPAGWRVDVYLSRDALPPIAIDHLLVSLPGPALAPGQAFVQSLAFALPAALECDTTWVWARVDPGDVVPELDEAGNLVRSAGPVLLYDCDPVATVAFSPTSGIIGEAQGAHELSVTMSLVGGAITSDLTVAVSVGGGDATEGADFETIGSQELVFPAGSTSGVSLPFAVTVLDDLEDEPVEQVELALAIVEGPGVIDAAADTYTLGILDDDEPPPDAYVSFAAVESTVDEDAGTHAVSLVLEVDGGAALVTDVAVVVIDLGTGDATAGLDFMLPGTPVVFPAGSETGATVPFTFEVLDDIDIEPDETLALGLGPIDGAAMPGAAIEHVVTLLDDDSLAQGGSFSSVTHWPTGGRRPVDVEVGDWNQDGFLDLVVANFGFGNSTDSVNVIYNQGGDFTTPTIVQIANSIDRPYAVLAGDVDGGGTTDIVAVGQQDPDFRIFLSNGAGFPSQFEETGPGTTTWRAAMADLDGDTDLDLVIADGAAGVALQFNDGTGTAFPGSSIGVGGSKVVDVEVASLDVLNDALPDLVVVDQLGGTVTTLLAQGGGAFTLANTIPVSANVTAVAVGDLDDDGLPDLVVSNVVTAVLDILFGDGLGGVSSSTTLALPDACDDVLVADINDDGFADLCAVVKGSPGSLAVRFGDGTGAFPNSADVVVENAPKAVRCADFDNDGKKDLVVVNLQTESFSVAYQD